MMHGNLYLLLQFCLFNLQVLIGESFKDYLKLTNELVDGSVMGVLDVVTGLDYDQVTMFFINVTVTVNCGCLMPVILELPLWNVIYRTLFRIKSATKNPSR